MVKDISKGNDLLEEVDRYRKAIDEVLSTIRPREEPGVQAADHIHNVVWHEHNANLYLVCQAWNAGHYTSCSSRFGDVPDSDYSLRSVAHGNAPPALCRWSYHSCLN